MHNGGKDRGKNANESPATGGTYLLEVATPQSTRKLKQITAARIKFEWEHYSELARQRSAIQDKIKQSLIQTSISYEIKNWQRAVKYKYCLHPLSTQGSLAYIGGRFNTGMSVNSEVPVFPGLYLAQNKDTALQEHLGQEGTKENFKLTPRELALTNPASETIVSINGQFDKIFDLTNISNLDPFVELIKNFKLSQRIRAHANKLGRENPLVIKTTELLHATLLDPKWREFPSNYDVPANSQIFGHLVYSAGIEGILYRSKFTDLPCLVIFPRNFFGTDSCVYLNDDVPDEKVPRKLDAMTWRLSEMDIKEIQG